MFTSIGATTTPALTTQNPKQKVWQVFLFQAHIWTNPSTKPQNKLYNIVQNDSSIMIGVEGLKWTNLLEDLLRNFVFNRSHPNLVSY